jgi:RNA polymerase sigma-70 factor, ECF subfamily
MGRGFVPVRIGDCGMSPTKPADPEELLRQARAGDTAALGQLLETYRRYLGFLVRQQIGRRLQGKADPSDLVQEAFLGAARDFAQFRGGTEKEFLAWLRQVLASLLANHVRHYQGSQKRDVRLEQQLAVELEESSQGIGRGLIDAQPSPSQQADRREQSVLLLQALDRLSNADQELLTLRHLEGLTFAEVAERLGRTLDSVKKQWPRALLRLKKALTQEGS